MLRTLLAASLGGMASVSAPAQDSHPLDEIVVTATRTAQTAEASLAAVTVITRADIERSQAQSLQDLLRGLPGVAIANNGGPGKVTSVYLRGTESGHVLVLVDGVRLGSASLGTAAFQDLPLAQIERIEVVRGPRSSLYGSEAIGGVIQIFTRRGGGAWAPAISLGAGSRRTWQASIDLSGGGEGGWYSLGLSGLDTAGIDARVGGDPDRDGYRNLSGRLRLGHQLAGGGEVEFNWLRAASDNRFDGTPDAGEGVQQVVSGRLRLQPTAGWQATVLLSQGRDESDNFNGSAFYSRFDTRRDSISWQNDIDLAAGLLSLGLDHQDERVAGTTAYAVTSRARTGVFAQYQTGLGGHDLQASLRHDDDEQFGGHLTGGLAWGRDLGDGLRLTVAYGTAFKAPTFNSLYYPWGMGNPDLRPEQSRSLEAGLAGRQEAVQWSLHAHATEVEDLIDWACMANCGAPYDDDIWRPDNVSKARILGLEAAATARRAAWTVRGALTLQRPENRATGDLLPRRAERMLRLEVDRDLGAWGLGATLYAEGRRYDDVGNTVRLPAYAVVDLRADYRPARSWRLQARLENLFDRDYETAAGYRQPGRGLYVTLRWQPEAR